MKRLIKNPVVAAASAVLLALTISAVAAGGVVFAVERACARARCMGIKPICPAGKHATCICESDYSLRCSWICAGR